MTPVQVAESVLREDFLGRVRFFLAKLCVFVANEDPATPNHVKRTALACEILRSVDAFAPDFALAAVASNPTNAAKPSVDDIPDADLEFAISSVFTAFIK